MAYIFHQHEGMYELGRDYQNGGQFQHEILDNQGSLDAALAGEGHWIGRDQDVFHMQRMIQQTQGRDSADALIDQSGRVNAVTGNSEAALDRSTQIAYGALL